MSKYIIKNCECKVKGKTTLCVRDIPYKKCENITDCKLKQIVELCKNTQFLSTKNRQDLYAVKVFANDLLKLLDIQEVK